MWHVWGTEEMHKGFWWRELIEKTLGRSIRRWVDDIKMYLKEVELEGVDWNAVASVKGRWRALVNAVMNFRVP
jgi:hypothetical protein